MKTFIAILVITCIACGNVLADSPETYRFRTFSPKGGFYYDGVIDIEQDNDGFIWILLDNDLQRFDGYEYKKYSPHFHHQDATGTGHFCNIAKDVSGCLHVLTSNGIFKYDKLSDSFTKIMDTNSTQLAIDGNNTMWCVSDGLLYKINPHDTTSIQCMYDNKPIRGIGRFSFDNNELFISSYYNRVYRCDYKTEEITLFHLFPQDYSIIEIKKKGAYLWVLTKNHGVIKIDIATRKIEQQLLLGTRNKSIPVKTFLIDKKDRIWIGTQGGLYILDSVTGKSQLYLHSGSDPFSLPNNSIWTLFSDYHQNIWIGHYAGGLCYVDLDESLPVKTYNPAGSALSHELVSSFAEDGDCIYVGTEGGGLNCLDKSSGTFSLYKRENGKNSLSYDNVKSLAVDYRRRLWVAMYRGGLDCFDIRTKQFRHFRHNPADGNSLLGNDLRKIVMEKDSGLWVAYQANRTLVSFLSFKNEQFMHYEFGDGGYIFDLQKDHTGHLYALTRQRLYGLDISNGTVEKTVSEEVPNGQALCIDEDNNVWIGTVGHGLLKYDPSTGTFSSFSGILDHQASAVYSLCPDTMHCLWLGTDNGLFRFDTKNNICQRFDESDGFQGQVYYPLASLRSSAGEYYFGGTNGFTVFVPQNVRPNLRKPEVRISDFYINNEPVVAPFAEEDNEIRLKYDQANFGFKFSSDNYLSPEKNLYKYRLKGYDDRWITTNASGRAIMYSKVPAGSYYFEMLAANNDGIWNETPAVIKITRQPAPWASVPAYLLYAAVVLGIVALIIYYYNEKRKLNVQLYIDALDKQKKEELHQSQLRFFTNISHDFKTPLSLIMATVDNLKQDGLTDDYYRILFNNSRRLLNLVNELMDFRTIENNKMKLHIQPIDVNRLVTELASDFKDYARKKNITFCISCDPELPPSVHVDKQIMEKVVMNLLNNAFKYTTEGGEIRIETYSVYSKFVPQYQYSCNISTDRVFNNEFLLVVRDTGIGISKDSIKKVFERFYTVNTMNLNLHLGTGIGLALVKSLVLLHKGTISIFSERDKGTDIAVYFPTDSSVYDASEFAATDKNREQIGAKAFIEQKDIKPEPVMNDISLSDRKRILVVEDNNDLRVLLSGFLSLHYDILEAADGVEALGVLKDTDTDLILSDILMPRKNGIELCREVKADINTSHIPFILLTAKSGPDDQMEGANSGADLYFAKPVDFNLLLQSIRNIFRRQSNLCEYYAKHYYAESAELSANKQDADFLKKLTEVIDANLESPNIDVNHIASELCMSRSKLYAKLKALTGKSIVEFMLNYKMRKAARLMVGQNIAINQVMSQVGIKSQSYFVNAFKKEFGETPTAFIAKHKAK